MQAGDAHIVNPLNPVAHDVGRDRGLLGDRQIAGPRAEDGDGPRPTRLR